MRTSTETNEIAAALAKAQAELQNPQKNRTVNVVSKKTGARYSFDYATLDTILAHARPILGKYGLSIVQGYSDDRLCLTTRLMHASGQWIESDTPVLVTEDGAQAMGGAITYARRYGIVPLLALAADEDDDANAADGNAAEKHDRQPGAAKPVTHAAALGAAAALLPWVVEDAKSQHATCRKHPTDKLGKKIYLLRYEGNGSKGKWVKYNCPMKDPDGNERGYCKTSGFADEIFGEGAT